VGTRRRRAKALRRRATQRSFEYSRQWNVTPQQNTIVDSMQGKQALQTRASTTHAQAWARHVQASVGHARTKGTRRQGHGARKQGNDTRTQRAL